MQIYKFLLYLGIVMVFEPKIYSSTNNTQVEPSTSLENEKSVKSEISNQSDKDKNESKSIVEKMKDYYTKHKNNITNNEYKLKNNKQNLINLNQGFASIIKKVAPAVVSIITLQETESKLPSLLEDFFKGSPFGLFGFGDEDFFGFQKKKRVQQSVAAASGFCVETSGNKIYIATNYHVVEKAKTVAIFFANDDMLTNSYSDKTSPVFAKVHGVDPKSDLAVLEVDLGDRKNKHINISKIQTIDWGNSEESEIGNWVIALGNPFGLGLSASEGILSAKGRQLDSVGALLSSKNHLIENCIQHTAPINCGNSGGVLVNIHGEVIGVNSAIYSPNGGNVGVGFAIPSETAKSIIYSLIKHKRTFRGWLGISIRQLKLSEAKNFGIVTSEIINKLPLKPQYFGAIVLDVVKEGPADKAGIKPGDIIIAFNSKQIDEKNQLPKLVNDHKIKKSASVTIVRTDIQSNKRNVIDIEVNIGDYKDAEKLEHPEESNLDYDNDTDTSHETIQGLRIITFDKKDKNKQSCVVVEQVLENNQLGEWFFRGMSVFKPGDIIDMANGTRIKSSKQLKAVVDIFRHENPNESMTFLVRRPEASGNMSQVVITTTLYDNKNGK